MINGGSDEMRLAVAQLLAAPGDAHVTPVARSEAKLWDAVAQLQRAGHDLIVADLSARNEWISSTGSPRGTRTEEET